MRRRFSDEEIRAAYFATSNDVEAAELLGFAGSASFLKRRRRLDLPAQGVRRGAGRLMPMREIRKTLHAWKLGRKVTTREAAFAAGLKVSTYRNRLRRFDMRMPHRREKAGWAARGRPIPETVPEIDTWTCSTDG